MSKKFDWGPQPPHLMKRNDEPPPLPEREERPRKGNGIARPGFVQWVNTHPWVIAIALFGAMVLIVGVVVAFSAVAIPLSLEERDKKQYNRREFEELVRGHTPNEVISLVGKPATEMTENNLTMFGYIDKTHQNGKVDGIVLVTFRFGIAVSFEYHRN